MKQESMHHSLNRARHLIVSLSTIATQQILFFIRRLAHRENHGDKIQDNDWSKFILTFKMGCWPCVTPPGI